VHVPPVDEKSGVYRTGIVTKHGTNAFDQRRLAIGADAVEDRENVLDHFAEQCVPEQSGEEVPHGLVGLYPLKEDRNSGASAFGWYAAPAILVRRSLGLCV
jgi:hypothetical protein